MRSRQPGTPFLKKFVIQKRKNALVRFTDELVVIKLFE